MVIANTTTVFACKTAHCLLAGEKALTRRCLKKNVQETLLKSFLRETGKGGKSDYCSIVVGWCITLIQTKISFKD